MIILCLNNPAQMWDLVYLYLAVQLFFVNHQKRDNTHNEQS